MSRIDIDTYASGIQEIVNKYGNQVFNDSRLFTSLLNDIIPFSTKGNDLFKSTLKPCEVLIKLIPSAPPCSHAFAIETISVTLGVMSSSKYLMLINAFSSIGKLKLIT